MEINSNWNPSQRVLMGPGPSAVAPRVLQAMGQWTIGHLDPEFLALMDETMALQRYVYQTANPLTVPVSGTGSAGMEAAFVNLLEPGDRVVVGVNGVFGERMCDVASRCGAEVRRVEAPWGRIIDPADVAVAIKEFSPRLVAVVHAETSTGVRQPLEEIEQATHAAGALLLVDCVTSLGGVDLRIDEWKIDLAYSGTQKCLSCPPGLSPVTFSERALQVFDQRKTKVQSWYLDIGCTTTPRRSTRCMACGRRCASSRKRGWRTASSATRATPPRSTPASRRWAWSCSRRKATGCRPSPPSACRKAATRPPSAARS